MALTVVWLVEQLLDGQFPGQQEISQGLAWGAVLQQHDGTQGFCHCLVRARAAAQQGLALLQDGGSATGTSWESLPEPHTQLGSCADCQSVTLATLSHFHLGITGLLRCFLSQARGMVGIGKDLPNPCQSCPIT